MINAAAASVHAELLTLLDRMLPGYRRIPFPDQAGVLERLARPARVVVCGGDGTVSDLVRRLSGRGHELAIIPAGTFNNVARSLGIPVEPEAALRLARNGEARPCTVGVTGSGAFVEAVLIGEMGEAIAMAEAAKERRLEESIHWAERFLGQRAFQYRISGDVTLHGRATSLAVANTRSTGSLLQIATTNPLDRDLELHVQSAGRMPGFLAIALRALLPRAAPLPAGVRVRQVRVETERPVPVFCDGHPVGSTPLEVRAWPSAISIVVPGAPLI